MANPNFKDPDAWIPKDIFTAYVGAESKKLLAYYDFAKEKRNPLAMSFDWFAILALPAWLGYRRQWVLWSVFVGLVGLIPFVEHLAGLQLPNGAFVGVGLAMGMLARGLLLLTATGNYLKLKNQKLDSTAITAAMSGRAKGSVALAVVAGVGSVIAIIIMSLLADALLA